MGAEYHYSKGGQSFGPISVEQLRQLAATGQITATDLVWKEGMAEWLPAARFKGLIPAAAPVPAAPAPAAVAPAAAAAPVLSAPTVVAPTSDSTDSSHEFRLVESAPAPVVSHEAFTPKPKQESEPIDDATQAEVFARQAKEVAMAAGTDALKAFQVMAKNPVGGLRTAYENLGPSRAMQVGIVFAVLCDLVVLICGHPMLSVLAVSQARVGMPPPTGWSIFDLFKLILIGCVPFGCAVGGLAASRAIGKGEGSIFSDIFIAGASLVPITILIIAGRVLGLLNAEVTIVIFVFAMTTTVLILYSGCTTLQRVSETIASLVVPLIFVADLFVIKVIAVI